MLVTLDLLTHCSEFSFSCAAEQLLRYQLVTTEFVMAATLGIHPLCCSTLILY